MLLSGCDGARTEEMLSKSMGDCDGFETEGIDGCDRAETEGTDKG